jgi:hypothetical protein
MSVSPSVFLTTPFSGKSDNRATACMNVLCLGGAIRPSGWQFAFDDGCWHDGRGTAWRRVALLVALGAEERLGQIALGQRGAPPGHSIGPAHRRFMRWLHLAIGRSFVGHDW